MSLTSTAFHTSSSARSVERLWSCYDFSLFLALPQQMPCIWRDLRCAPTCFLPIMSFQWSCNEIHYLFTWQLGIGYWLLLQSKICLLTVTSIIAFPYSKFPIQKEAISVS